MHTLSSARRTCMASESAVECTATVAMPSSRQARWMRRAISPRLAIRILPNNGLFQNHQHFSVFDRGTVLHQDRGARPRFRRLDLVEGLHRLDQQQRLTGGYGLTDRYERRRTRLRVKIGDTD